MTSPDAALFERIWRELDGPPEVPAAVALAGAPRLLPSIYDVGAFASGTVAAAVAAIAALEAARRGDALRAVRLERGHAAVAFRSERYLSTPGGSPGAVWDPLAGDYAARDGWIRLHTNYAHHRDAVLRALGVPESRERVAAAVRTWAADDLESAVVGEGGCAARLRSAEEWAAHPQGEAVAREPLFQVSLSDDAPTAGAASRLRTPDAPRGRSAPLEGIRVLDLTRVMAGPVCTRVLAAYGAEVLRIDPPGFEEVAALLPEMTAGKRRASLDLRREPDRAIFERLVGEAHVIVHGYRADALERLGFGAARRRELNPSLLDVSHDAYGWTGPWVRRRGFDSLVQMSTGIAERGRLAAGADRPVPLPAQALDHACGYLLAAAACRALLRLLVDRRASEVRLSLARVAKLLVDLGDTGDLGAPDLPADEVRRWCEPATTAFGPVLRVRCPGGIDGIEPRWAIPAGPLGVDAAAFAS